MPRKNLIKSNVHPYHVTARCNNREEFYGGSESSWAILCYYLNDISALFDVKIHAFVMMPNHFHLLMSTPAQDLGVVMHKFMLSVTKTMNAKSGRSGRIFGGRYHWSLVNSSSHFDHVQKYIYRNPVKANLVNSVEGYYYSSLRSVLGLGVLNIPLTPAFEEDFIIPANRKDAFLVWLNQPFQNEEYVSIRNGLRKTTFAPTR